MRNKQRQSDLYSSDARSTQRPCPWRNPFRIPPLRSWRRWYRRPVHWSGSGNQRRHWRMECRWVRTGLYGRRASARTAHSVLLPGGLPLRRAQLPLPKPNSCEPYCFSSLVRPGSTGSLRAGLVVVPGSGLPLRSAGLALFLEPP